MSDRVELTDAEREALEDAINESLDTYANASFLIPAVASIVAARIEGYSYWSMVQKNEALRAELASTNARCAELETLAETGFKRAEFTESESIQMQADLGSFRGMLHNAEAERDALQARLDRVTALADEWDDEDLLAYPPTMDNRIDVVDELRAALADSGTKDGSNDE